MTVPTGQGKVDSKPPPPPSVQQKPRVSSTLKTDKRIAFLFCITLGFGFLMSCVLTNVALLITVHGSIVVHAEAQQNNGMGEADVEVDPKMAKVNQKLMLLWIYSLVSALITIPEIYSGLRCAGNIVIKGLRFNDNTPLKGLIFRHAFIHGFILLMSVMVTATACTASVLATSDWICKFFICSLLFVTNVQVAAYLLARDIKLLAMKYLAKQLHPAAVKVQIEIKEENTGPAMV